MSLESLKSKARFSLASAVDRARGLMGSSLSRTAGQQLDLSELESRILLSVSPAAVVAEAGPAAEMVEQASLLDAPNVSLFEDVSVARSSSPGTSRSASSNADQFELNDSDLLSLFSEQIATAEPVEFQSIDEPSSSNTQAADVVATEVAFVDESAENYQQLVDDLEAQREAGRAIDIVVLRSDSDGIDQIAEALSNYSNIDSVHILSHGTDGAVKLGDTWLRLGWLDSYAGTIAGWGSSLNADGDILFYGCDLASDSRGEALVESISALTGADVAASTDDTGHTLFGGDWDLEFHVGQIESQVAVTEELQSNWGHLLNVTVDSTSTGTAASGAASVTVNHTTSGADRLMLVGVSFGQDKGDTVSSITYNGQNLTLVGAQDNSVTLGSRMEIWSLVAPTVSSADVVVTFSGTNHIGATVGVMTFNGVDQTTALGSFASSEGDSSTPSTTVTSAPGELVFGVLGLDWNADIDLVPGPGQTEHWDLWQDKATGGGTTEAGAASVVTSWTLPASYKWAAGGVSIKPSGAAQTASVVDQFNTTTYDGNDGTVNWTGDWQESGESDGPATGGILVTAAEGGALRIGGPSGDVGKALSREADLDGATAATLSFDYKWDDGISGAADVCVEVRASGTDAWTNLATIDTATSTYQSFSTDISGFASSTTQIRFVIEQFDNDVLYVDNVQIAFTPGSLVVDTTNDIVDGNVSTIDDLRANKGADGFISLREAIIAANNTAGADEITLAAGNYQFALSGTDDTALAGDLDILESLTITGAGADSTFIDADGIDRVFHIKNISTVVNMSGVTIQGGSADHNAGGIFIDNDSTLNLSDAALKNNDGNNGTGGGAGGAIHVHGTLNAERVLFSGNTAKDGGAIFFHNSDGGTLTNVTISGNTAAEKGGAVYSDSAVTLINSTVANNLASSQGGGLYGHSASGVFTLQNTILAENTANSDNSNVKVAAAVNSLGHNIDSDGTGGIAGTGDQSGTIPSPIDVMFGPLQDNGGTTETHALLAGSPAINAGTTAGSPSVDQRGEFRDGARDIGAYEFQSQFTSGSEFVVNTTTGSIQETSNEDRGSTQAVAVTSTGEYVVVWSSDQTTGSDSDGFGVLMQRFDASGIPIGSELQVNDLVTGGDQYHASVAVDNSGRGVVVWTNSNSGTGVKARLFNSDGSFNGSEFSVNTTGSGDQKNAAVAMDATGNFVVVWEGNGPSDGSGIHAQRFDANGSTVGAEFTVNDSTSSTQSDPSVAMNSSGQFAVVWDDGNGVHVRSYEADGTGGSGSQVNVDDGSSAGQAAVAIDSSGRFIVTWRETSGIFGKGVYRRAFNFDGTPQTGGDVVNTVFSSDQTDPSITIDAAGNYIIAWEGNGTGDSDGVFYQKYDAGNSKVGSETRINQTTSGAQDQVSLAMLDIDNFVAVWTGEGDSRDVFTRQFGTAASNQNPIADAGGPYVINEGDTLNLNASGSSDPDMDSLTFAWDLDNDGNYGETDEPVTETANVSWSVLQSFGITDDPGSPFTIGVQVDDARGGVDTATTTVTVNNVSPAGNSDSGTGFSTDEDTDFTTGNVLTNDSDPNSLDVLSVTILDDTGTAGLVTDNGDGTFDYDPNGQFESLAQGQQATDTFSYTVSDDDGGTSMATVSITIDGVNDAPTDISLDNQSVSETMPDAVVGNLSTADVDAGDTHTYAVDDLRFEVVGNLLKLKDTESLDFETEPTVNITVTSADSGGLSTDKAFLISVTDLNDNLPVVGTGQSFNVSETASNSTSLGFVTATDDDAGTVFSNWQITGGNTDNIFSIDSGTGELLVADNSNLDFETTIAYALTITVSDGANTSLAQTVGVNVTPENDNNPVVTVDQSFNVSETATNATSVGLVAATDADAGTTFSNWSITGGNTGGAFAINSGTGEIRVANSAAIDFESSTSFDLMVTVSDGVNTSVAETVTINVTDQNDEIPVIPPGQTLVVSEAAPASTVVGTVTANDADAGTTFNNWTITGGNTGGAFALNASSGVITVANASAIDFETSSTFNLTVTVSDGASTSAGQSVTINVSDANEAPTDISLDNLTVAENSAGAVVGNLSTSDQDTGDTHTYTVDDTRFEVVAGQLKLKSGQSLDFEVEPNVPLTITTTDSGFASYNEGFTLSVTDVDESPVVTTSSGNAAFTEDLGPVAIDSGLTVTDPENAGLTGAEIRFDSGFASGQDSLLFTNQAGITGSFNTSTGVLTLTGSASVAAYETALRSVTFDNSSQAPGTADRVLRFTVDDGTSTGSAIRTLTVTPQDDPANVAPGGPYAVDEGGSVLLDGSSSNDIDNFIVEYEWDFDYDGVAFTADSTGSTTTFSASSIDGPDTRTVALRTRSDNGAFALATTTVTVSNIAPTAVNDSGGGFTTAESTAFVTGNVLANDTDPGPESLTVSNLDTTGTIGLVTNSGDGTFDYDPIGQFESLAPGQSTTDSFVYEISDGTTVDTATVTVTINGANDAPSAADGAVFVNENLALNTVVATASGTDVDAGDSLSWAIVSGNTNGAFSIDAASGQIRVAKPLELNFETNPSFGLTVQASDQFGGTDTAVITVSLNDLNERPTASDATLVVAENSSPGTSVGIISGSDPDAGDSLNWSIISGNASGAFALNASTGELTVANQAALDFETTPTFNLVVELRDGGGLNDTASVAVTVSDVNETPITSGIPNVTVSEDSPSVSVDLTAAFSDVETPSSGLTYSVVGNSNPTLFSGTPIGSGKLLLNFAPDANGNATITVRATDPGGQFVNTSFAVTVTPVADAPTSQADTYVVVGEKLVVPPAAGVLANDSDADGDSLSALLVTGPDNGSLVLLSNGGFTYTPDEEFVGIDSFVYQPFDGTATGPPRTVALNVTRVIAPPPPPAESTVQDSSGEAAVEAEAETVVQTDSAPPVETLTSVSQSSSTSDDDEGIALAPPPGSAEASSDEDSDSTSTEVGLAGVMDIGAGQDVLVRGQSGLLQLREAAASRSGNLSIELIDGMQSDGGLSFEDSLRFDGEDLSYLVQTEFIEELDEVEEELFFDAQIPEWATGTAVATSASISVGYIVWMIRGGYVLASVISTMPVWQTMDPLPVLDALDAVDDDDESLESMIEQVEDAGEEAVSFSTESTQTPSATLPEGP